MYKMKPKMLLLLLTVVGAIFLLTASNIRMRQENAELRLRTPSDIYDAEFITAAAELWASKTHAPRDAAMKDRYARVIHLEDSVCVSIEVEAGGVGGAPVYCFDKSTKKLTMKYDEVE